eukprot:TRINITY_DN5487_c0_g2_i2.p1 TRINITY_DN5487_c0_g2~~TRINITY_DN5487_c0_g2_i2.p1  ORF type:complete len:228 (-),score=0.48 TRINITY_DN5487_c0_g2_i2:8-691(-)
MSSDSTTNDKETSPSADSSNADETTSTLEAYLKANDKDADVPEAVMEILRHAAATGSSPHKWEDVKRLCVLVLKKTIADFEKRSGPAADVDGETFSHRFERIETGLLAFEAAPFTFQRICELLVQPGVYKTTEKFFGAFCKTVSGIRTTELNSDSLASFGSSFPSVFDSTSDGKESEVSIGFGFSPFTRAPFAASTPAGSSTASSQNESSPKVLALSLIEQVDDDEP